MEWHSFWLGMCCWIPRSLLNRVRKDRLKETMGVIRIRKWPKINWKNWKNIKLTQYNFAGLKELIGMYIANLWNKHQNYSDHNQEKVSHQTKIVLLDHFNVLCDLHDGLQHFFGLLNHFIKTFTQFRSLFVQLYCKNLKLKIFLRDFHE